MIDEKTMQYMGDGVYASFDGHSIRLSLGDTVPLIFLEWEVMRNLIDYAKQNFGESL